MNFSEIHSKLAGKFGEQVGPLSPANKDAFAVVKAAALLDLCEFCKTDPDLAFDCLMNLSTIDWPKKNQIEAVYHLFSYSKRHTFIFKVQLDRANPVVASVERIWKAADWLEREQFDLMGVTFTGHPDLRRIMMPDDWVGSPLRKDYKEQGKWHNIDTTRESPLDGFVRLDELRKKAHAAVQPAAAPAPAAPKKETLQ